MRDHEISASSVWHNDSTAGLEVICSCGEVLQEDAAWQYVSFDEMSRLRQDHLMKVYLGIDPLPEKDEDPDACLAVILGKEKGSKTYAAVCLADAIRHGNYPEGWT